MTQWKLYYCDGVMGHVDGLGTPSHAVAHMKKLLSKPDRSYVGLTDEHGVSMQFAGQPDGLVVMDVPCPEQRGSWSVHLPLEECCARVEALTDRIDPSAYPDLSFVPWGGAPPPIPPVSASS